MPLNSSTALCGRCPIDVFNERAEGSKSDVLLDDAVVREGIFGPFSIVKLYCAAIAMSTQSGR